MSTIIDEINKALATLKAATTDFSRMVGSLDGRYDLRENEIKAMESRIAGLKEDLIANQNKANDVIQKAGEEASLTRKEANRLLEEAKNARMSVEKDKIEAAKLMQEARSLMDQAKEQQRTADSQWQMVNAKKKKLEEAMRG